MREGVSRVVTEVVILVLAVLLALMIFSPVGDYISRSLQGLPTVSEEFRVIEAGEKDGKIALYIQNLGEDKTVSKDDFIVFINGEKCSVLSIDKNQWKKYDVVEVKLDHSPVEHMTVKVFLRGYTYPAYFTRG